MPFMIEEHLCSGPQKIGIFRFNKVELIQLLKEYICNDHLPNIVMVTVVHGAVFSGNSNAVVGHSDEWKLQFPFIY